MMLFWALFLFAIGVTLIVIEFILPGAICGIAGVLCLIGSAVVGINAYPNYAVFIVIGEMLGAAGGIATGLLVLAKTRFGRGLFLETAQSMENENYTNLVSDRSLVGRAGTVLTALRPSGTIEVDGERVDAVSDGTFIEEGAHVQVTEVYGNRVVVEPAPESSGGEAGAGA